MNKQSFSSKKPLLIIADADIIIAQAYADDANHAVTLQLVEQLHEKAAHIIFPTTAITEAITAIQRKLSNPQLAATTLELFTDPEIAMEMVDEEVIREAKKLFDPKGSKQNTLFDCIVATLANKYHADAIFSFDDWYTKLGFKLASQIV